MCRTRWSRSGTRTAKLGVTHFALAGNSMGGAVAWNYALAHPEKVDALILIDAAGAPVAMPGQLPLGFRIARMPVIRRLAEGITPRPLVEKTVRQTIYKQLVIDDRMIDRYWELLLYPGNRRATALRFSTKRIAADTKAISRLHMPVLVMWGREDSLMPLTNTTKKKMRTSTEVFIIYLSTQQNYTKKLESK